MAQLVAVCEAERKWICYSKGILFKKIIKISESVTAFAIQRIRWASRLLSSVQVTASGVYVLREMNESGWDASAKGSGEEFIVASGKIG